MSQGNHTLANQLLIAPITFVLFLIVGIVIINNFELQGSLRITILLGSILFGLVVAGLEVWSAVRNIRKASLVQAEREKSYKERQREMILKAFNDEGILEEE